MEPLLAAGLPHYRAIVALDIERSTSRPDPVKAELRNKTYELFDAALYSAGIRKRHRDRYIDRGDGLLALIHPVDQAPKALLLNRAIPALRNLLADYNASLPRPEGRARRHGAALLLDALRRPSGARQGGFRAASADLSGGRLAAADHLRRDAGAAHRDRRPDDPLCRGFAVERRPADAEDADAQGDADRRRRPAALCLDDQAGAGRVAGLAGRGVPGAAAVAAGAVQADRGFAGAGQFIKSGQRIGRHSLGSAGRGVL